MEEGYDEGHDRDHGNKELARAAVAYLLAYMGESNPQILWPWGGESFKPSKNGTRDLEKAGALIAAEVDRVVRCGHG